MDPVVKKPSPGGVQHRVTKGLRAIVGHACRHPIHTLLVTALTAATTHLHVLEGTYQATHRGLAPWAKETPLNVQSFLWGSRTVTLGEASAWRWQIDDRPKVSEDGQV
jgi:hydroxymethylglutaryl-CoA reductase (NADPH)